MLYNRFLLYVCTMCMAVCFIFLNGCFEVVNTPTALPPMVLAPYSHAETVQSTLPSIVFADSADEFAHVTENVSGEAHTYQLNVDSGTDDIWRLYFVLSNTSGNAISMPKVTLLDAPTGSLTGAAIQATRNSASASRRHIAGSGVHVPQTTHAYFPDLPALSDIRSTASSDAGVVHKKVRSASARGTEVVGDVENFFLGIEKTTIEATARYIADVDGQRVVFWAPNSVYTGCVGSSCLPTLIEASDIKRLADAFIQEGDNNDLYDRMKDLFGSHWGAYNSANNGVLIPGTVRQIDVLLHNIENRGYDGGVVGYYWRINNLLKTAATGTSNSNERLILHIHAPWLRVDERFLRELNSDIMTPSHVEAVRDGYYYSVVATLVHEYQHMINFYERDVVRGAEDSAWINEQFSVIAEDLFGQIVSGGDRNAADARGLSSLDSGEYGIIAGRIPAYACNSALGVSVWNDSLANYGANYSFGSYLLRNYGATTYLRTAYDSRQTDSAAVSAGLASRGITMGDAIGRWGIALMLSDNENAPENYRINFGDTGTNLASSYPLGSINYYNYSADCSNTASREASTSGALRIFNSTKTAYDLFRNIQDGHSNIIFAAVENLSGSSSFKVTLQPEQQLSVVAKRVPTQNNPIFY